MGDQFPGPQRSQVATPAITLGESIEPAGHSALAGQRQWAGCTALAGFEAVLTLPGIAGIVLTIGMAVDANVLINERIREELRAGRAVRSAVEAGYKNALPAILDSNITTFLSGVILFQFGTGPIKGFAVTLCVGIITTVLTAVYLTRIYYDYRITSQKLERISI